jgi:hypothetical protein
MTATAMGSASTRLGSTMTRNQRTPTGVEDSDEKNNVNANTTLIATGGTDFGMGKNKGVRATLLQRHNSRGPIYCSNSLIYQFAPVAMRHSNDGWPWHHCSIKLVVTGER